MNKFYLKKILNTLKEIQKNSELEVVVIPKFAEYGSSDRIYIVNKKTKDCYLLKSSI